MNKTLHGRGVATGVAILLSVSVAWTAPGQEMDLSSSTPLKGSLLTVPSLTDWSFGVSVLRQRRELTGGEGLKRLNATHITASTGYSPFDWLQVIGSLGEAKTTLSTLDGEYGVSWGLGTRVSLLEFPLEQSPVIGRKRSAQVQADVFYRGASTHFDTRDFQWTELFISPTIVYQETYRAATDWPPYQPLGSAIRAGLVYSGVQGKLESDDLNENRNFGILMGANIQMNSDVVVSGTTYGMSSKDLSFEVGLNYYF